MPPPVPGKIVVTHLGALRLKYGSAGVTRIRKAVRALATADAARGLRTRLVALDDPRVGAAIAARVVDDPADHVGAKAFVDAVSGLWHPEYLMLLGSTDVVPAQPLENPLWTGDRRRGDPDEKVPSDLPYACDNGHSLDPGDFRGATRAVGRLPDTKGAKDPELMVRLLNVAAGYRKRRRAAYLPPFAVTAKEWRRSTAMSLQKLVGSADALYDVPPGAPPWPDEHTRRRLHLVNCHGGPADPRYYGQSGRSYPIALHASEMVRARALMEGTVVAAECCYGGMLYDPAEADGVPGFVDTYLGAGVYGYCASTTTSYGPSDENNMADLVCRFFLQHVLSGCSLGRAMLQARQDYVFTRATLSPFDLKTLAQFNLYGDPSIHPVARAATAPSPDVAASGTTAPKGRRSAPTHGVPTGVTARRRRLQANGRALDHSTTYAATQPRDLAKGERARLVAHLAVRPRASGTSAPPGARLEEKAVVRSFEVRAAPLAQPGTDERFHVLLERKAKKLHAVLAREEAGRIEQVSLLQER